jgi:hypothetical protein
MKYWYRCIFLCAGFLISRPLWAYTGDSLRVNTAGVAAYADSLLGAGNFYDASLAYEKAAYFSLTETERTCILLKRAVACKYLKDFTTAEKALATVNFAAIPDSLHYMVRYEAAFCSYAASNFQLAESHLIQLFYFVKDSVRKTQAYPLYALVLNELEKWGEAREILKKYGLLMPASALQKKQYFEMIDSLYAAQNIPRLKNVSKAGLMSRFFPGSGQIYAGYWGEGLGSLTLNVITLGATAVGFYYHYYFTSFMIGFSIFERFYMGNVKRAEFLAAKTNYKRKKKFNEAARQQILSFYPD